MSFQKRTPGIKLTLDKDLFNQLISVLDYNKNLNIEDEDFSSIAEKLKDKLLKYSVPRTNEEEVEFVDVRFFPNEASDMIWQLLLRTEKNDNTEDYYSQILTRHLENAE